MMLGAAIRSRNNESHTFIHTSFEKRSAEQDRPRHIYQAAFKRYFRHSEAAG
jgi:hypothetical protein